MCGACGDCIYGTFMYCLLPCISKRLGHPPAPEDQEEAPRPVGLRPTSNVRNAAAVKEPSRRRVSIQKAHEDLIVSLAQPLNEVQTAALSRLHTAFLTSKEDLSPEFFAPVIADLDTVLFNGSLGDRVVIDWADMPATSDRTLRGATLPRDIGRSGISKVVVRFNKAILLSDMKEEIWGTVAHEMLHACVALMSNWSGLKMQSHGSLFEGSCKALVASLSLEGLEVQHVV